MYPADTQTLEEQLFEAITAHKDQKVVDLLASGAVNPNTARNFGRSPLTQAAAIGTHATIVALVEHGADPNLPDDDDEVPLLGAAWEDRPETVLLLMSLGADPERAQGGLERLLEVIEDRSPACNGVFDEYIARRQAGLLEDLTAQTEQLRPKPRI